MPVLQPYSRVVGTDGFAYLKARSRPKVPYIPQVPVLSKHSLLTRLRATNNGVTPPVGGQDGMAIRDAALVAWYGNLGGVGSPYAKTGPTKDQVGLSVPYSDLTLGPYPITQESVSVTTTLTFDKKILHGRFQLSGAGKIIATNCVFTGPATPSNAAIYTGETAIIDGNAAGVAQSWLKDCVMYCKVPHPRFNAHKGSRMKLERVHIFWVTDGCGPYSTPGQTFPTAFELVASRIEKLVYWPGPYFANKVPNYWNGTTFTSAGSFNRANNGTASDKLGYFDDVHNDGVHTDCIEIHNAFGTHTFNPTTQSWAGDGIHIWGNALVCDDAYGAGNPSNLPLTIPLLGYGDNPKRGLSGGGQLPGMARPVTSWLQNTGVAGVYAANGVSLYIGQVTNVAFEDQTSVVAHDNYFAGGNMGFQEQRKTLSFIPFVFYDNIFGNTQADARFFRWASDNTRDMYPVRVNDYNSGTNLSTASDTVTQSGNLLSNGDQLVFTSLGSPAITGVNLGTKYFVVSRTSTTFKVAATSGGSPITLGTSTGVAYSCANIMPNFTSGPVRIPNHPVTGAPPFGSGASNVWTDGAPLLLGSSTLSGVRVI